MEFEIKRALPEDGDRLTAIMEEVTEGLANPAWFVDDDAEYIKAHVGHIPVKAGDCGFILKAVCMEEGQEETAGFFMVDFPGTGDRNLGHHIMLEGEKLIKVAHMDSVVILPKYRGHKLQYKLIEAAEEILRQETDYEIWMATVHPDNKYSLDNVQALGYQIVAEAKKYGGYPRYVLMKERGIERRKEENQHGRTIDG